MRGISWLLLSLSLLLASPAFAADTPPGMKGLWLIANYPAVTARAGDTATIALRLRNDNLPPERVALSVDNLPDGWKAHIEGGGSPVGAAMADTNDSVPLSLKIDVPAGTSPGDRELSIKASGIDASASLPVTVDVAAELPAKLTIKADLPALKGSAHSSFDYQFTVANGGDKDLTVGLIAEAPPGFQASFTEGYGTQEITSIPIPAGQSKELKVHLQPPADVAAGKYSVRVHANGSGVDAATILTMQITGAPKLALASADGRLSSPAVAGKATTLSLIVSNDGGAPAHDVQLSSSAPADWAVTFEPKSIPVLDPGQKQTVQASVTPSARALAGDYMATLSADSAADASSADFRMSVSTSTLWGIVGIGIIAAALLVAAGAVLRYGRR